MKRLILLAAVAAMLSACSGEVKHYTKTYYTCPTDKVEIQKRSEFILQCVANANPKSDEEPEDWLYICENMSLKTFCNEKQKVITYRRECFGCLMQQVIE